MLLCVFCLVVSIAGRSSDVRNGVTGHERGLTDGFVNINDGMIISFNGAKHLKNTMMRGNNVFVNDMLRCAPKTLV